MLSAGRARAQDRFEIQVYDSETAGAGQVGLETHWNYIFAGTKLTSPDGEEPNDHTFHLTFEPHVGLGDWGELGCYFQTAATPADGYEYAGVKLRFKLRYPRKLWDILGLAINFEVSSVPHRFEPNEWGSEIRPVADVRWRALYVAVNPIIDTDLKGQYAGQPQFAPAAKGALFFLDREHLSAAAGLEYYSVLGPFGDFFSPSQQFHTLYGALDIGTPYVDVNVGFGHGFAAGESFVGKAILGFHGRAVASENPASVPAVPAPASSTP